MDNQKMPGFTADLSLDQRNKTYYEQSKYLKGDIHAVHPAMREVMLGCHLEGDFQDGFPNFHLVCDFLELPGPREILNI
jgi:hypothetical protein